MDKQPAKGGANTRNTNIRKKADVPPEKTGKRRARSFFKGFGMVFMTVVLVGITTAAICGMALAVYINKYIIPESHIDFNEFRLDLKETSFIYYKDKNGNEVELHKLHGGENRVWASIDDIPENLKLAFISIEDNTFYSHSGVNWRRTLGASINFVVPIRDNFGGGSTITQQLIKNVTGDDETSVSRKITEIMRALELEKQPDVTKDDILEMYLNTIYFGQNAYGVQQAAMTYFSKEMKDLTIGECAAIAGIVKNPYKYDLFRYPEHNEERRLVVLGEMLAYNNITQAEYDKAKAEVITPKRPQQEDDELLDEYQSYYVDAVIDQVIKDLKSKKGMSDNMAQSMLFNGGLKIVISVDMELQDKMDAVFKDVENFPGDLGSNGTYPQAAMVLIDPETGRVLAMYGGRGEKYGNRIFNRATSAHRQPGSAIKPLTVYTPAFEYLDNFLPITVLDDAPKDFEVNPTGWPKNENRRYSGRCTIYRGVGSSLNTIAVDVMQQLTPNKAFTYALQSFRFDPKESLIDRKVVTRKDGTENVLTDIAVSPLALGGLTNGVTVMEMTAAYATFVNGGYYKEPILYEAVYTKDEYGNYKYDEPLLDNRTAVSTDPIMSARTRDYMIDLLTYVTKAGTGTKARIEGVEVGGKTGTTSDDNDRWFAGITPEYAAVVWFGYDMPQSLQKFSTNPSLELWHRVMSSVYEDKAPESFQASFQLLHSADEYTTVTYCQDSGKLATEACANDYRGSSRAASAKILKTDAERLTECDLHMEMTIDINTGGIANDFCPEVDLLGNPQKGTRGVLVLRRTYPHSGVAVADQEWVLDYELTPTEIAQGLYKPTTPCSIVACPVHDIFNDGNIIDHPDDSYVPYDPDDPLTWIGEEDDPTEPSTDPTDPWGGEQPTLPTAPTEPPMTDPTDPTDPGEQTVDPPVHFGD